MYNNVLNIIQTDRDLCVRSDLFASHRLKHLLQLYTKLLNVVKNDAGLQKSKTRNVTCLVLTAQYIYHPVVMKCI